MSEEILNPAELASKEALEKVLVAIDNSKHFRLEAGAGAGKTYSLIKSLKHLINNKGIQLQRNNQQIACITYTEVARDEIRSRIDNSPVVLAETIHSFSWGLISSFQQELRNLVPTLSDRWVERTSEMPVTRQKVIYSLGYPKITEDEIYLHHDDVIKIITALLAKPKFQNVLLSKYPIVLIDEYQDTNIDLAKALVDNIIETEKQPMIGLFGDHWQKIYDTKTIGLIDVPNKLEVIGKNANFRSDKNIVEVLNRLRPDLPQNPVDPNSAGVVKAYHTNDWQGTRKSGGHWKDDLPDDVANQYLDDLISDLKTDGWEFDGGKGKILMLTNTVLANKQGYANISELFSTDDYLKKGNRYIEFFEDVLEPGCIAFQNGKYGEMFKLFNIRTIRIKAHADKIVWNTAMDELMHLRVNGTINDVIEFLKTSKKPRLTSKLEEFEDKLLNLNNADPNTLSAEDIALCDLYSKFKSLPYLEIINLVEYNHNLTPFSTKHGVKGAEFENVLVVCGRGWNLYNWSQMLEWIGLGIPAGRENSFERNRNLFYVSCSRPQKRLAVLFTQALSANALATLQNIFNSENVVALPHK
jgi:DNA helicase-2/ATP-dependent DNA helicase PcrA